MLRKCQLAGHKRAAPKTKNVLQCLQFAKIASANMVAKKKEEKKKREKKERRQDAN